MADKEKEFKLPISSIGEIKKLMIAYAKSKSASSLADINKLTGMNTTAVSGNNGFLESIGAIQGGNSKEATPIGKKLGLAYANNMESEVEVNLRELLMANTFIDSMLTALEIKPRTNEDFQSHIAYSLHKEAKGKVATGAGTLIDLLKSGGMIEEKEGLLYPKKNFIAEIKSAEHVEDAKHDEPKHTQEETGDKQSLAKQITRKLGNSVTLNINIQLTIPETENEKVYENFFEAMKKHLLS